MSRPDLRADAVRNREAVLAAADTLFSAAGSWEAVSMNAVASAAGVGKGTVFRAFGDRAGLLRALTARRSSEVRDTVTTTSASVESVLEALLDLKLANRPLFIALDALGHGSPYAAEHYGWWHALLTRSLTDAGVAEPDFHAHALLGAVRSDLVEHLLSQGLDRARIHAGLVALVGSVLG